LAIKIGTISIQLSAETASFQSDMTRASQIALNSSKQIERSFTLMGTAIVAATSSAIGALGYLIDKTEDMVFAMQKMAQQSGNSMEEFSKMAYVAKTAGMPVDQLAVILTRVSASAFEAANGNKQTAAAYKALGISVTNANGTFKTSAELFRELAGSLDQFNDSAAKTGLEKTLMGRSGAQSAAMLHIVATRMDELSATAARLNVVFGGSAAEGAQHLHEAFLNIEEAGEGLSVALLGRLTPALDSVANKIVDFVSNADNMKKVGQIGDDLAKGIYLADEALEFLINHFTEVKVAVAGLIGLRLAGIFVPMAISAGSASGFLAKMGIAVTSLGGKLLGLGRMGTVLRPLVADAAGYTGALLSLAKTEGVAATASYAFEGALASSAAAAATAAAPIAGLVIGVAALGMEIKILSDYHTELKKNGMDWVDAWHAGIQTLIGDSDNLKASLRDIFTGDFADFGVRLGFNQAKMMPGTLSAGKNFAAPPKAPEQGYTQGKPKGNLGALPQEEKINKLQQKLAELEAKAKEAQTALGLVGASPKQQLTASINEKYAMFLIEEKKGLDALTPSEAARAKGLAYTSIVIAALDEAETKYQTHLLDLNSTLTASKQEHLAMAAAIGQSSKAMQDAIVTAKVSQEMQKLGGANWAQDPKMLADSQTLAGQVRAELDAANLAADTKQIASTKEEIDAQNNLNKAILQGAEAKRQATIANEQAKVRQDFTDRGDTDSAALQQALDQVVQRSEAERTAANLERASAMDVARAYQERMKAINDAVEAAKRFGVAIDYTEVLAAQKEAWQEFWDAQDKAILATGSMMDGLKVALGQIARDAESDAQRMHDIVQQAINSLNDSIAKLMTTGSMKQANFAGAFKGIGDNLAKASLQKAESAGLKALGFGGAGKPDGSSSKPFYVVSKDKMGAAGGNSASPAGGLFRGIINSANDSNFMSSLFGGKLFGAGSFFGNMTQQQTDASAGAGVGSLGGGLVSQILGSILPGSKGTSGAPDGSSGKPFYVVTKGGADTGSGVSSLFSGLMGGTSSSSAAGDAAAGASSGVSGLLSLFQGAFADGTDSLIPGMPALVGEKGPELFVPPSSGSIVPNSRLKGIGGGDTHINIDARGSQDPAQTMAQIHAYVSAAAPQFIQAAEAHINSKNSRSPSSSRR
jgi:lambda family phage tail tape measure protein